MSFRAGLLLLCGLFLACDESEQLRAVAPELSVLPTDLDFGAVPLGATKRLRVELSNTGNAPLDLSDVMVEAPFFVSLPARMAPLAPGESLSADVGFRPVALDPASAAVTLVSNDPAGPRAVALRGSGADSALTVTPSVLMLSDVPVGQARSREIFLENLGLVDLSDELVAEGFPLPGFFTRAGGAAVEGAYSVAARSDLTLDITYRPLEPGNHGGVLRFQTCEGRCGVEVEVVASAISPVVRLEPPELDFGEVGLGMQRTLQLVVRNDGTEPVRVLELASSGGATIQLQPVEALPATLAPGEPLGVDVTFSPTEALELSGTVVVRLDDVNFPEAQAGLRGRGVGPLFAVQPGRLSFGVVTDLGAEARRTVLGLNAGSATVEVLAVRLSGDPAFRLEAQPGLPVRLGSGETVPISVAFAPRGMGVATATLTFESSDPQRPEVQVPLEGGFADRVCEMDVDPSSLNFGAVVPGFQRDRRVTLTNRGTEDCRLTAGTFRAPLDAAVARLGPDPFPTTLAPGTRLNLEFRYAPSAEAEMKALFTIRTDEPVFPVRNISLLGTGAGYLDLFTEPRVVDFGEVRPICPPETETVNIVNAGSGSVVVTGIALTSSTTELGLNAPPTPFSLGAGTQRAFSVSYDPNALGADVGLVEVGVQDLPFPLVVPIQGEGSATPRQTDRFEQAIRREVDVLFVIDDSCSMRDEQAAIAQNFRGFIQAATQRSVDFQIGVTTTTILGAGGRLRGPPLTANTPNLERSFQQQVAVGTGGSGLEQGLEAMALAIRLADRGVPPNRDLFRPSTAKAFILISDEDDSSLAPPLTYSADLRQRYPNLAVAVISGQATGCRSQNGSATRAPRYEAFLSQIPNALSVPICSGFVQLEDVGRVAFGLTANFQLSRRPDLAEPIVVTVNGVPQTQGADFTFDPVNRSVVFTSPPPEGSTIEATYTPECGS